MKIIFVVPYVPNIIRVRPYNLIRQLSNLGHKIALVTIWTSEQEWEDIEELKKYCQSIEAVRMPIWRSLWNSLITVPTSRPLQASYSWQSGLARSLRKLTDPGNHHLKYDLVHIEHLRGVRYGIHLKSINSQIPIVWDSVDCISHLFRQAATRSDRRISRWLTQFELYRTEKYEAHLITQFDRVLVTSAIDRDAFTQLVSPSNISLPITVLPNGVDLEYFQPDGNLDREPATLVVTGKMSYHANISMVLYLFKEIMPIIWSSRPNTKLWIVGKDPPREIKSLAQHPAITVTGTVMDIRPYLRKATVALAPLTYGAGIQNKVLEAMACGTPVVTSPQVVSALNVKNKKDILVAQEPEYFSSVVVGLLDNPGYCEEISLAGRKYVEEHHRWESIGAQLEGIYNEVTHN